MEGAEQLAEDLGEEKEDLCAPGLNVRVRSFITGW